MSCGATILVISPRQNLYSKITDSHEEDFVTRSAVGQKKNYVKNQKRQHWGSIALTTLALLLIITVRVIFSLQIIRGCDRQPSGDYGKISLILLERSFSSKIFRSPP